MSDALSVDKVTYFAFECVEGKFNVELDRFEIITGTTNHNFEISVGPDGRILLLFAPQGEFGPGIVWSPGECRKHARHLLKMARVGERRQKGKRK